MWDGYQSRSTWHREILIAIEKLFAGHSQSACLYGLTHAIDVEKSLIEIIDSTSEFSWIKQDDDLVVALRVAALLHDVGFATRTDTWSVDGFEHIPKGLSIARDILGQASRFCSDDAQIAMILAFIEHHDDTSYTYPSSANDGHPITTKPYVLGDAKIQVAMELLRHADGIVHAQRTCLAEAVSEWHSRQLPCFSGGSCCSAWSWNVDILSNIRLVGKRAIVDAMAINSIESALSSYRNAERAAKQLCEERGVGYAEEVTDYSSSLENLGNSSDSIEIEQFRPFLHLKRSLRDVRIKGDPSIKPYKNAEIKMRTELISSLSPLALYVICENLDRQKNTAFQLMNQYALGLWDLSGWISFRIDHGSSIEMIPPLVEFYEERDDELSRRMVSGIVDGLHRITAAKEQGIRQTNVVEISNVPWPLPPLPVDWSEVRVLDTVPPKKRQYRFNKLHEFATPIECETKPRTDDEARYFYYRDLNRYGSKGVR